MFRPNLKCELAKMGETDVYGKRLYGAWTFVDFAIVKLEQSTRKTSVRTDASGTRSFAHEDLADARLLFPAHVEIRAGDKIRFLGFELTVMSVFPRHRVTGEFDHWQVDCNTWNG